MSIHGGAVISCCKIKQQLESLRFNRSPHFAPDLLPHVKKRLTISLLSEAVRQEAEDACLQPDALKFECRPVQLK